MSADHSKFLGAQRPLSESDEQRLSTIRTCFDSFESFFRARASNPVGHPAVGRAVDEIARALHIEATQLDALVAGISRSGFHHFGTGRAVWTTDRAVGVARAAVAHDIRFLALRPTIDRSNLHRLLDVLDRLRGDESLTEAALELDGSQSRFVFLDRSAAALGGVPMNREDAEPNSELRAVHKLFRRTFDRTIPATDSPGDEGALLDFLTTNAANEPEVAPDAQVDAAFELRRDLTSPERTEVRRAAALCSALTSALDATTRNRLLEKARRTLVHLLERNEYDGAQHLLEELELWHDDLASVLEGPLRRRLLEAVTGGASVDRNAILSLFDSWERDREIGAIAAALEWRLPDAVEDDLVEFFGDRFEHSAERLPEIIDHVTTESAMTLVEHAGDHLPPARGPLLELLKKDITPVIQAAALETLRGHFAGAGQIDEYVTPLVGSPNSQLRNAAIDSLVEIAPDQVGEALQPFINETLARRSDRDLAKLVANYARFGGDDALADLRALIRVRRLGDEAERELSVRIVEALEEVEVPEVDEMLAEITDEWTVAGDVQQACERILEAHGADR